MNIGLKLTRRERIYVTLGGLLVTGFVAFQFIILPLVNAHEKLRHSITVQEKALEEVIALRTEYQLLRIDSGNIGAVLANRSTDFTLFSFLEEQAGRAGIKTKIKYMKPSLSTEGTPYKESSVEMSLEGITLKELVGYLYLVESPENLVRIKRMSVKQSKGNTEYLTALIHVVTYQ